MKFENTFSRFDRIHERDRHPNRQKDGQTDTAQWHRLRLCIASSGKDTIKLYNVRD